MRDLVDFGVLTILYFGIFYRRWRKQGNDVLLVNTTMYIYLAFVLYFTLMPVLTSLPFIFNHSYVPMNLEPFIDVTMNYGDCFRQIILNVVMTIPFGFLLPLVGRKYAHFAIVVLFTFLLSFSIEVLQPLISSSRSSDITDLITNVIGGMIGYVIYLVCRPLTTRILKRLRGAASGVASS